MISFGLRSDRSLLSCEPDERLLLVDIHAPQPAGAKRRAPVNLALVVDRSGSMAGAKLKLALAAARQAIRALDERDRFSVVVFDDHVQVPIPSRVASRDA